MKSNINAKDLPIYDRAVARYPHISNIRTARAFCFSLCQLAMVPGITWAEYTSIARVANGGEW